MSRLLEDENLIEKCTKGPWYVRDKPVLHVVGPSGHGAVVADLQSGGDEFQGKEVDAQFIARARERWPQCIKALKQIEEITTDSLPDLEGRILEILEKLK